MPREAGNKKALGCGDSAKLPFTWGPAYATRPGLSHATTPATEAAFQRAAHSKGRIKHVPAPLPYTINSMMTESPKHPTVTVHATKMRPFKYTEHRSPLVPVRMLLAVQDQGLELIKSTVVMSRPPISYTLRIMSETVSAWPWHRTRNDTNHIRPQMPHTVQDSISVPQEPMRSPLRASRSFMPNLAKSFGRHR